MIFGRRDDFRLAINAAGGAERDAFDAAGAHGFEHVERGGGVLLEILVRMVEAKTDIRIRGQMKNEITPGHRAGQRRQIQAITLNQFAFRIGQRRLKKFPLAGGKIVPADDSFAVGKQPVHEIAADESGRAGHEDCVHL